MKKGVSAAVCLAAAMIAAGCASQSTGAAQEETVQEETVQEEAVGEEVAEEEALQEDAQEETQSEDVIEEEAGEADQNSEEAEPEGTKYESAEGWYVTYDSSLFSVDEAEDGVIFTYTGECTGTDTVKFNYYMNRMPDEVLYDAIATDEGLPEHERSEGYWAGREDVWSMRVRLTPEEGSDVSREFIAVEHNGGTLLIEVDTQEEADEEAGMKISDAISNLLDSFVFTEHEEQTYSYYVPGKYVQIGQEELGEAEYYVELNADHTGVVSLQDEIPVIWYSREGILLNAETGEQIYEYVVEGDSLYLIDPSMEEDRVVLEFERE